MDGVPCPDVLWDLRGSVNDELFAGVPIGFVGHQEIGGSLI